MLTYEQERYIRNEVDQDNVDLNFNLMNPTLWMEEFFQDGKTFSFALKEHYPYEKLSKYTCLFVDADRVCECTPWPKVGGINCFECGFIENECECICTGCLNPEKDCSCYCVVCGHRNGFLYNECICECHCIYEPNDIIDAKDLSVNKHPTRLGWLFISGTCRKGEYRLTIFYKGPFFDGLHESSNTLKRLI